MLPGLLSSTRAQVDWARLRLLLFHGRLRAGPRDKALSGPPLFLTVLSVCGQPRRPPWWWGPRL